MTGGGVLTDVGIIRDYDPANQKFTGEMFKVATLSAIGGFLFGYDTGIVSGAMIYIRDTIQGPNHPLSDLWQEAIISVTILSAWMFSIFAGSSADRWGRRKVILVASVIFAIGSILMGIAPEKWTLLIGRFIVGAGIGLASMIVPTYIAEMAPTPIRGSLVVTCNVFITGGQAFAAVTAGIFSISGIEKVSESLGWRLMLALAAVPAVIQFVGFLFMPESPRWLIRKGFDDEARAVLQRVRGPDADVSQEFNDMKSSCVDADDNDNNNLSHCSKEAAKDDEIIVKLVPKKWILIEVLRDKYLRKALFVGCMLQVIQQLTGINTVMYYAATIITMSGVYDKSVAVWMASATALVNFLITIPGIYLVEKIGRRSLTLVSLTGVTLSLAFLAISFHIIERDAPKINLISTDYGFSNSSSMIDLVNHCSSYNGCSECIKDTQCGYCFDDHEKVLGSCLAGDETVGYGKSLFGRCSNGTIAEAKRVWAVDWCPSKYSWFTLLGLCIYLVFFAPGMGPMPWTINSEIFPLWCRGTCYSTTTSFNWFFNFLVSVTFLSLTRAATKQGAFWIYAAFGLIGLVFFYFNLPETKGKSLEDTSKLFGRPRPSLASNQKVKGPGTSYGTGSNSTKKFRSAEDGSKGHSNTAFQSD